MAGAVPAEQLLEARSHEQRVIGRIPHMSEEDRHGVEIARGARGPPAWRHTNLHHPGSLLRPVAKSCRVPANRSSQLAVILF